MATDNKTSVLVEQLLPDFLDTEGPKFQSFVKAYYEWMEQSGQMTEQSKNLLNNQDIDLAAEEFLTYFKREILPDFPEDILADKRLVYKKIKDLYRSKGSEESYKLLFRILYDEELDFYYPGQDILRASDGRWIQETSLRLTKPFVGNPDLLAGEITGRQSGATAKIERVQQITTDGIEVYEVFVTNIDGTFLDAELIDNAANNISGTIISSSGTLQNIIVTEGGSGHQRNDIVTITSASGSGGRGRITITDGGVISKVAVTNAGSGFIRTDPLTLFNTSRSAVNATAAGLLSAPISYTGRYNDVKGFISWSNKLQDNRYYQEYSYVLRSSQVLNTYKEIVKNVVHPAGMRLFGDVLINVDINNTTANIRSEEHTLYIYGATPDQIFIPEVISASVSQYEDSGDDGGVVPRPEIEIELIEAAFTIDVAQTTSDMQPEIELIAAQTSALLDADAVIESYLQRLIEGVTLNTRTANLALLQVGEVWDPKEPSSNTVLYSNTGAVWLTANGYYLEPDDNITTIQDTLTVGIIEINDGIDVIRSGTAETVNTYIMYYSELPVYALEDVVQDDWPLAEYVTQRTTIETFANTQVGELFDWRTTAAANGYNVPTDWTIAFAPIEFTITTTTTISDLENIDMEFNAYSPMAAELTEWQISDFADSRILDYADYQLNHEVTIPTRTNISTDDHLLLTLGTVNDDLTLGAATTVVSTDARLDMFFDNLETDGDEVTFTNVNVIPDDAFISRSFDLLNRLSIDGQAIDGIKYTEIGVFANTALNAYANTTDPVIFRLSAVSNDNFFIQDLDSEPDGVTFTNIQTFGTDTNIQRFLDNVGFTRSETVSTDNYLSFSFELTNFISSNPIETVSQVLISDYSDYLVGQEFLTIPTTAFSTDAEMYNQGSGTVTLAYVDSVQDVQDQLIGNFDQGQVDSLEGTRRWVEGIGTSFTTETSNNSLLMIRDTGNTNTLVYNTVQYVDDANTLFLTSNVAITIVDGDIFYRN